MRSPTGIINIVDASNIERNSLSYHALMELIHVLA